MSEFFSESETIRTYLSYQDANNPYLVTQRVDDNGSITRYNYKANGDLQSTEDTDGFITQFFYAEDVDPAPIPDKHRHLLRRIQRPPVTLHEGTPQETTATYNPTEFEYDSNGNLEKIIDAKGEETIMTYSGDGMVETITDRNGHTTEFVYEGTAFDGSRRRLLEVKVPKGLQISDGFRKVVFAYNDSQNPENVTSVTDDLNFTVTTEYDALDRVVKVTDARGKITEFTFADGSLTEVKSPANSGSGGNIRLTSFVYNSLGLLDEVKRDMSAASQETRVKYTYNGFFEVEKMIRIKDGVEKSFTYQRDALGRPIKMTDTLGREADTHWQDSCSGNSVDTARGVRRILGVDSFCRTALVMAGTPATNGNTQLLNEIHEASSFEYDELGRLVKTSQVNRLYNGAMMGLDHFGQAVRTYLYDELDRLVEMKFEDGRTVSWEYDPEGNLTKVTDPEGGITEYSYYRDNLLHQVIVKRSGQADRVFTYSYDAAGRLDEIEYPSSTGLKAIFRDGVDTPGSGFDGNGNIRFLRYEKTGASEPLRKFEWTYDDSNNRETMLDISSAQAVLWEYEVDWLDRLTVVRRAEAVDEASLGTPSLQRGYEFDESDNRRFFDDHVNGVTYHYIYTSFDDSGTTRWSDQLEEIQLSTNSAGDRNLANFSTFESFVHDDDGNMTKRTLASTGVETNFEWSDLDRLHRVETDDAGQMTRLQDNRYDVNGLRKRKMDKNKNTSIEYDVGILTSASRAGTSNSNAPSISYLMGHMLLGVEVDDGSGAEFVYMLHDALSSARDLIDEQGNIVRSQEFDEYGNLMSSSGATTIPKSFVGGLSVNDDSADSGMFNMGHRNYSAGVLGRFISRDPIGFNGSSLNLYAYPTNPVTYTDASGLDQGLDGAWNNYGKVELGIHGKFKSEVLRAIDKIEFLGYDKRADLLRSKLKSGTLHLQRSPFNVGFNNPFTGNISIDKDYCEGGNTDTEDFIRLVSLLFHESTHAVTQSRPDLLLGGLAAYVYPASPIAEQSLEGPIYKAQRDFLQTWAASEDRGSVIRKAIESEIGDVNRSIRRLDHRAKRQLDAIKKNASCRD